MKATLLPSRNLNGGDASMVKTLRMAGWSMHDIASLLGCNSARVSDVINGKTYPSVEPYNIHKPATQVMILELLLTWQTRMARMVRGTLP